MTDGVAVEKVAELAQQAAAATIDIEGRTYSTTPLHDPRRKEPEPAPLILHTLLSLTDYVKSTHDQGYMSERGLFVHVRSATEVAVLTDIFGQFHQRVEMAVSRYHPPEGVVFGQFMNAEAFNIALQACFEDAYDRVKVLETVGRLAYHQVQEAEDDGVTQQVTLRAGAVRLAESKVPNPVQLAPLCSFPEIDQVVRPFVLRLSGGGETHAPVCALFEADGGAWERHAVAEIAEWLRTRLPEEVSIFS